MFSPERKFVQQHRELCLLNTSNPNSVNSSSSQYVQAAVAKSGICGLVNRWIGCGFQPHAPTDNTALYHLASDGAPGVIGTGAMVRGYNDSPFALSILQGVGVGERIGRDVSVLKDDWYFRWTFPSLICGDDTQQLLSPPPSGSVAEYFQRVLPFASLGSSDLGNVDRQFADGLPVKSFNHSQRPMRVRMVGIMESVVDSPGDFGFTTSELFESQFDIHSRLSKDQASGYRVIYDKTKSFTLMDTECNVGVTPIDASTVDDKQSAGRNEAHFRCRVPSYLRRYEGKLVPDNPEGYEIQITGGVPDGGVARGAISWFFFVEDVYCPQYTTNTGITASTRWQTPLFLNLEVNRKTLWIDP